MNNIARNTLLEMEMIADLAICLGALILASSMDSRLLWQRESLLLQRPLAQLVLAVALVCGWHLSFVAVGAYRSHRLSTWWQMAVMLAKGAALATGCSAAWSISHVLASGGKARLQPELLLKEGVFFGASYALLLSSRVAVRCCTNAMRSHGRNLRYVLVVGSNDRAVAAAQFLIHQSSLGFRLAGFIDDRWHTHRVPAEFAQKLIGDLSSLPEALRTLPLDEVVVALPIASQYETIRQIVAECRKQGIIVRCEASFFDLDAGRGPAPSLITLHEKRWNSWSVRTKRLLDLAVSSSALLLLLPLFAVIAVMIKLNSPGPVFFLQERIGAGKRRFKIVKFRTMVPDAERLISQIEHLNESGGPTFKLTKDPRITAVGRVLRKTSLDELPQFINVFLGDMSLVGPRPLPLRDYQGFSEDRHRRRFSVKPGITCLWQIMGRSSLEFERWMELDMNYIDTWSIWLDLKILLRTIPAVVKGAGAV